jgi:hypothetical protein
MNRRLADKIVDALETAWEQGREEVAKRLSLIHQALMEEEPGVKVRRRSSDEEFDAEDAESFKLHNMYQDESSEPSDDDPEKDQAGQNVRES